MALKNCRTVKDNVLSECSRPNYNSEIQSHFSALFPKIATDSFRDTS